MLNRNRIIKILIKKIIHQNKSRLKNKMQRKLMFLKQKMIHKVKERMNNPPKIGSIKTDTTIRTKNWALNIKKVTKNMREII